MICFNTPTITITALIRSLSPLLPKDYTTHLFHSFNTTIQHMGSSQSSQLPSDTEDDDDDDDAAAAANDLHMNSQIRELGGDVSGGPLVKKVLEQEPELLPCHSSASPLSPQLSSLGTPRLGPSIKVWDPYNVLAPPPPSHFSRTSNFPLHHDPALTHVYFISHGDCHVNLRPDLISGRCPDAALTPNGKRQARALAVFLNSQGVRFTSVYASPLDRARATALLVCQELDFSEEQIQSSDALMEMSQGHWEGCHRSDIFTSESLTLMERFQPDFAAPSGESLRQVEFRMVQFLNGTILRLPEKCGSDFSPPDQSEMQGFPHRSSHVFTNSIHDKDGPALNLPQWDVVHKHRQGLAPPRRKSGKSRLQIVTATGDHEADDEMSPRQPTNQEPIRDINLRSNPSGVTSCIGVFTHSVPIKCLITGVLGCSAVMAHKISIDDSSITILQHSWKMGWQIKRLNDTAHLRLL